jgi:succinyl-diaminopimelate desuccinylase
MADPHRPDLLAATADLMAVPSVSHEEGRLADAVENRLRKLPHLRIDRVGDNVVARTELGRSSRLLLAGHLDTVPPNGNAAPRVEGDTLHGLGATDMKGGLAVMLELADAVPEPAMDVTWVFYAGEEVAAVHNGLGHLFRDRPDLVAADAAILGEPTDAAIEAGCQGTLRARIVLRGARAHTAPAWMGRNAIHRAGELLSRLDGHRPRRPVLDGCQFHEAIQAVAIEGGVAGNVVPDEVTVTVNVRFAPDRTSDDAEAQIRGLLDGIFEDGDAIEVVDRADAAPPSLNHPLLGALCERSGLPVKAKLGWTDVARFAGAGIPAVNFGPGDARLAHTAEEYVERSSLEAAYRALLDLLRSGQATPGP